MLPEALLCCHHYIHVSDCIEFMVKQSTAGGLTDISPSTKLKGYPVKILLLFISLSFFFN